VNALKRCYLGWIHVLRYIQPVFLLAIRILVGWGFILAGWGKLTNIDATATAFAQMGIPLPTLNAYLAGTAEFGGGALLILGVAARVTTLPLVATMIVAYATAHKDVFGDLVTGVSRLATGQKAFGEALGNLNDFVKAFNAQPPMPYLLAALVVLLFGPGLLSVDGLLKCLVFDRKSPPKPAPRAAAAGPTAPGAST
jgi:putative oxidoreductase